MIPCQLKQNITKRKFFPRILFIYFGLIIIEIFIGWLLRYVGEIQESTKKNLLLDNNVNNFTHILGIEEENISIYKYNLLTDKNTIQRNLFWGDRKKYKMLSFGK